MKEKQIWQSEYKTAIVINGGLNKFRPNQCMPSEPSEPPTVSTHTNFVILS